MTRVDVMVPCYNYGRFLRECVDSVLAQSHRDLRVVIADDASTDETPLICAELAAQDFRVEVVRHEANRGHIATYNACIDNAGDGYMLILSADDFLLPGALARAAEILDVHPEVGLVHGRWLTYRSGDALPASGYHQVASEIEDNANLIARLARGNNIGTATAIVRSATQKSLGHYHGELPHSGDLEMWLRFALHSKVAYIHQPQAARRQHDTNMSTGYDAQADLRQCAKAFALNYSDIRHCLPGGTLIEARIRRRFARRGRRIALDLLREGKVREGSQLLALSAREAVAAHLLWLRTQLRLPT